jgi:hypothetical protein
MATGSGAVRGAVRSVVVVDAATGVVSGVVVVDAAAGVAGGVGSLAAVAVAATAGTTGSPAHFSLGSSHLSICCSISWRASVLVPREIASGET